MKKIGVLRANALGDVIVTTPAFYALKKAYPEAELVLLGRNPHKELFEGRESPVNRVIPLPHSLQFDRPLERTDEIDALIDSLRSEAFDLIVQLHGGGRHSNGFVKLLGPKVSLGPRTPDASELSISSTYNLYQHEVTRHLEILRRFGIETELVAPRLSYSSQDLKRGREYLAELRATKKVILLNPGAKDPRRRWPIDAFAEVARRYQDEGFDVLVNSGPDEVELAEALRRLAPGIHVVTPTLKELIGLILHSEFIVSNDTGTMHLALALKRPTVCLFWFRNVIGYAPLDSEHSRVLVSWNSTCSVCGKNCSEGPCDHEDSLIKDISTEAVHTAIEDLTQRSQHGGENRSRSFDRGTSGQNLYSRNQERTDQGYAQAH